MDSEYSGSFSHQGKDTTVNSQSLQHHLPRYSTIVPRIFTDAAIIDFSLQYYENNVPDPHISNIVTA